MKRMLRKGSYGIHLEYGPGVVYDLNGSEFSVSQKDGISTLSINLQSNLNVKNKQQNCYDDAKYFKEEWQQLTCVQITDDRVMSGLDGTLGKLALRFDAGSYRFDVSPELKAGSLWLTVISVDIPNTGAGK